LSRNRDKGVVRFAPKAACTPPLLAALIPDYDATPEWQSAVAGPHYEQWGHDGYEVARLREALAARIIWKRRDDAPKAAILSGDPFWLELAINVVSANFRWHRSGRVKVNALRALRWRHGNGVLLQSERHDLEKVIERALLIAVDHGEGEEFRAHCGVARAVPTAALIAELDRRITRAAERDVRINAARMLDVVNGKPYQRYRDAQRPAL
jgi:hypothetical protein